MKFWPIILGTTLLAGSGCMHYQPRPLAPEKSAALLESRRLDDAGLGVFISTNSHPAPAAWPLEKWDQDSLTLAAFYFHPDLAVARAQWQLAEAGVKTAGGRPNPTLTVTPQYNTTTFVPSPWGPSVSFDLPVETAGKRGKRIAEAEKISESARWNFVSAAWSVRSGVRAALADYAMAQRRLPLLQKQLAAQREIVRLQQQTFDAGETSRPELTTAQMALSKLQLDVSAAESQAIAARSRLAEALGVSVVALENIQVAGNYSAGPADDLTSDAARHAALLGRADIRAALADYAAAENDLQLEIAKQYPDVHLNPGYQFDQGDNKWSIGLTVELPVFNQNQGPITEARARRELSAAKFLQLQAQVIAQVERAVAGYQGAQAQMKTTGELVAAANRQHQSVVAKAKAGAATKMDLAAAEIELASAQLAEFDSMAQSQSALGALEDALQSPADSLAAVIQKIFTVTPQAKASHP
ncbi:MAG: TolC family protein [Verrucomicrobiae bacterium]|nr:TolC family protein [Verrucomicrobiae bacterium]